jgi:4-carboxymuconolactone decarboxylase
VRLAAIVTAGDEAAIGSAMRHVGNDVPVAWIEELVLQTCLFAGFPRALNAMREWRRVHAGEAAGPSPVADDWRLRGEATCAKVYGGMYERLRENVRALHPALDEWMVVDGYGKVLSRTALDLPRRELCIVAACAASGQDRQLHSHLHGALNAGVAPGVVSGVVDALADLLGNERASSVTMLWEKVAESRVRD